MDSKPGCSQKVPRYALERKHHSDEIKENSTLQPPNSHYSVIDKALTFFDEKLFHQPSNLLSSSISLGDSLHFPECQRKVVNLQLWVKGKATIMVPRQVICSSLQ